MANSLGGKTKALTKDLSFPVTVCHFWANEPLSSSLLSFAENLETTVEENQISRNKA